MDIHQNIQKIQKSLKANVTLIAVSKFQPFESIEQAYQAGQRVFGENRMQELQQKVEHFAELHPDIRWHFIGHLQSKKVKTLLPLVELIHAVDSEKLFDQICKDTQALGVQTRILLQVHIACEETKFGFSEEELWGFVERIKDQKCKQVRICGLMGMASFTDDSRQVRNEFRLLKSIFDRLKSSFFLNDADFCELSMGMSNDYPIAMEEGATLIRVGTGIFGERQY